MDVDEGKISPIRRYFKPQFLTKHDGDTLRHRVRFIAQTLQFYSFEFSERRKHYSCVFDCAVLEFNGIIMILLRVQ